MSIIQYPKKIRVALGKDKRTGAWYYRIHKDSNKGKGFFDKKNGWFTNRLAAKVNAAIAYREKMEDETYTKKAT